MDLLAESWLYYIFVALMFVAVLGPFVFAIYRNMKPGSGSDKRPIGLPVGSFRSILAYSLVTYLGFYVLASVLSLSRFMPPDFLLGIVATVVGFYFGSRSGEEAEGRAERTGIVRGVVREGSGVARGAKVTFKRTEDGTIPYSRIADVEGRFELSGTKPGKYVIQASLTGGASSEDQEVLVAEGSDHEIEIVLRSTAAPSPNAQSFGVISGVVKKPDGAVAPGAIVVVLQAGIERAKKSTDGTGAYRIDQLPPGEYEVQASLQPDAPSEKAKVTVTSAGQHNVDVALK